jgi:hypothetical protein
MAMLVLAGINIAVFESTARRSVEVWDRDTAAPVSGRRVAVLSLAIWVVVVFLGRWVGFSVSSQPAPSDPGINLEELENLLPK